MTKLSVVIPVYNAEKTIESLCNTLIDLYAATFNLEIILVNDYSKDSSHLICRRLQEKHGEIITYVRLARNFGEHNAVMAGLHQVTGEFCVIMDDDFQNPPDEVRNLVTEIEKGYDVVYSAYPTKNDSLWRNMGSRFNDKMANVILKKPADLYLSSFKVINRFLVDEIIKYTGPEPYIDAIILRSTANIGKIEVRHDTRKHGRSGYTMRKLVTLWGNMIVSYSLIPLRIMGVTGLLLTLLGIAAAGSTLVAELLPQLQDPTEFEKLTAVTAFFRGIQFLAVSIVGEYVGRIYLALHSDPQFVIRERFCARPAVQIMSIQKGVRFKEHDKTISP
ncbi:MAG TPA: glycosyltransferase family 2 protein [Geobacteraceae bacterium]